jgi:hypothetical protein
MAPVRRRRIPPNDKEHRNKNDGHDRPSQNEFAFHLME